MQELFFELLRVAVGQMDCLSRGPSAQEWHEIYEMARHHGLIGVCYKGVERLFEYGLRVPQDARLPPLLRLPFEKGAPRSGEGSGSIRRRLRCRSLRPSATSLFPKGGL